MTASPSRPVAAVRFARLVFVGAGIYGLLALPPMYFLEDRLAIDTPPAITHPEFFYGFVGVGTAWQVAFLVIGRDPVRHRPLMMAAMIEKFSFGIAIAALLARGRVGGMVVGFAAIDTLLGLLFVAAYLATKRELGATETRGE